MFIVTFEPNGSLLDAQQIDQSQLYQLWIENRDRSGRSDFLTDLIRQSAILG